MRRARNSCSVSVEPRAEPLKMRAISLIYMLIAVICLVFYGTLVKAVPAVGVPAESVPVVEEDDATNVAVAVAPTITEGVVANVPIEDVQDLQTAATEDKDTPFVGTVGAVAVPDNVVAASNIDPSIYAGVFSPEAFQQYVHQFGAFLPYGAPAYPSPVGYPHPPPQSPPYVVQTGYEGYLVPSTTTAASTNDDSSTSLISQLNPITLLTNLFPVLMMSTIFRVVAALATMIGMVFFGGALTTAICNFTSLCDISFRAVTYLRGRGSAERVGRMVAEEMTPERVRRATEFVRNAIRKYRQLQKMMGGEEQLHDDGRSVY